VTTITKADITGLGIPAQDTVYTHPSATAYASGIYKITVNAAGHVSAATAITKADITALGIPASDTTYAAVSKTAAGLAPMLPNETTTTKYLRQDGTWVVPPDTNTTYAAVSKTAAGLAPMLPNETTTTKYLRQDGTWVVPPDTNTIYTHPAYTAYASGIYKITVNAAGHVSAATAITKADITELGIPGSDTNTTYSAGTGLSLSGTVFSINLAADLTFTGKINVPTPALPS
jgi:hypothetical protein